MKGPGPGLGLGPRDQAWDQAQDQDWDPGTGTQGPGPRDQDPRTGSQGPGPRDQDPGTGTQELGPGPGLAPRDRELGTGTQELGPGPGPRDQAQAQDWDPGSGLPRLGPGRHWLARAGTGIYKPRGSPGAPHGPPHASVRSGALQSHATLCDLRSAGCACHQVEASFPPVIAVVCAIVLLCIGKARTFIATEARLLS